MESPLKFVKTTTKHFIYFTSHCSPILGDRDPAGFSVLPEDLGRKENPAGLWLSRTGFGHPWITGRAKINFP